jgi:hypothetical protein
LAGARGVKIMENETILAQGAHVIHIEAVLFEYVCSCGWKSRPSRDSTDLRRETLEHFLEHRSMPRFIKNEQVRTFNGSWHKHINDNMDTEFHVQAVVGHSPEYYSICRNDAHIGHLYVKIDMGFVLVASGNVLEFKNDENPDTTPTT